MNNIEEKIFRKYNIFCNCVIRPWINRLYGGKHHMNTEGMNFSDESFFMAPGLNFGAGIGHQIALWNSGKMMAEQIFGIKFAHVRFWINGQHAEADDREFRKRVLGINIYYPLFSWDKLLGFGENEMCIDDLKEDGYREVQLPLFNSTKESDIDMVKTIMSKHCGQRVIFKCAVDQMSPLAQNATNLRTLFWESKARMNDKTCYSNDFFNFAVHIRRGDVDEKMPFRYRSDEYFINAINCVTTEILSTTDKTIKIHIFSEGNDREFECYKEIPGVEFHLKMSAKETFINLVYSDALLISPSGFSANAALIGNARCYCPIEYKYYEKSVNWIYLDKDGYTCN